MMYEKVRQIGFKKFINCLAEQAAALIAKNKPPPYNFGSAPSSDLTYS